MSSMYFIVAFKYNLQCNQITDLKFKMNLTLIEKRPFRNDLNDFIIIVVNMLNDENVDE